MEKFAVRTVYMECWKDLTEVEKRNIEDLQIGVHGTLMVYCKAEVVSVKVRRGKHLLHVKILKAGGIETACTL